MYLKIIKNNEFTFSDSFEENNIEITMEDYDKFLILQSQGERFRLKKVSSGAGLFDHIEEYTPKSIEILESETDKLKQQILDLQEMISNLQFEKLTGGV